MGCNCGGATKVKKYVYVDENGKRTERPTEVEALALKIRNGGKGEVRPV